MRSTNSDLGVPVVDRRRRRRIITLRNFGYFVVAVLVVVAGLNIRSEMRDTTGDDDYGRLYGREMKKAPGFAAQVVTEQPTASPVDEATSADPFSLDAARREQYLGSPSLEPVPLIDPNTVPAVPSAVQRGGSVRVIGGPEGVVIVKDERPLPPPLGGGFGRQ